jgi:hypothetical protein
LEYRGYSSEIACYRRKLRELGECDEECRRVLERQLEAAKQRRRGYLQ